MPPPPAPQCTSVSPNSFPTHSTRPWTTHRFTELDTPKSLTKSPNPHFVRGQTSSPLLHHLQECSYTHTQSQSQ